MSRLASRGQDTLSGLLVADGPDGAAHTGHRGAEQSQLSEQLRRALVAGSMSHGMFVQLPVLPLSVLRLRVLPPPARHLASTTAAHVDVTLSNG